MGMGFGLLSENNSHLMMMNFSWVGKSSSCSEVLQCFFQRTLNSHSLSSWRVALMEKGAGQSWSPTHEGTKLQ